MMIKRPEVENGKQRWEDTSVGGLSKDSGTIEVYVETGGLFVLPNVACVFTHKLAPLFMLQLAQKSYVGLWVTV